MKYGTCIAWYSEDMHGREHCHYSLLLMNSILVHCTEIANQMSEMSTTFPTDLLVHKSAKQFLKLYIIFKGSSVTKIKLYF